MKFNKILPLFLVMAGTLCFAQKTPFNYKRKVNDIPQEGWYTLTLPPDIFRHTNERFNDLRLYNISGTDTTEIPYIINIRERVVEKTEISLSIINKSKKNGVLFLGFELAPGQKVNYINLEFEEPNYFGFVQIEGSTDKKEWFEIISQQRIFSIENNYEHYENGVVNFPLTDFKYLRVGIKSDTPLTLTKAYFLNQKVKEGAFENIPLTWRVQEDKKAKKTIVNIKMDHYRPVSNLRVRFSNENNYYRSAEVAFVTDSVQTQKGWIKNYQIASTGYVTSYDSNTFDLGFRLTDEVWLTIHNYDNTPLMIKEIIASGAAVELKAFLKPQQTFLFYGNPQINSPSYDISYFTEKIPATATPLGFGPEENIATPPGKINALFENKFWLWGIMLTIIAVLGFFTLRMLRT
jgi:hypothetical protein